MTKSGELAARRRVPVHAAVARVPSARTLAKREAITDAAIRLFLAHGYRGTSMDDVAAAAGVSKVTLYKQFGDKESLFSTIVSSVTARAETITAEIERGFAAIDAASEIEPELVALAVAYAGGVTAPEVLRLRRLVIAEAERHPELAAAYYAGAPQRALHALGVGFARLAELGLLRPVAPETAAVQFAYLVLGSLVDRALFRPERRITRSELTAHARSGVAVFLAAYGSDN